MFTVKQGSKVIDSVEKFQEAVYLADAVAADTNYRVTVTVRRNDGSIAYKVVASK